MDELQIVITTVDTEEAAARLSFGAVDGGLAASGQVTGPVATTYRHLGEVLSGTEWQVTFRTAADRVDALRAHLIAAHPYDSPEVIALPIASAPPAYLAWITRATRPSPGQDAPRTRSTTAPADAIEP
ncbi:divalent-cation tolerance protein CutA [Streptomyces avicenniae]|uniref:divalent-cation tolerance protein CutA n=1 Tax=Streptomyces avicenniae TaxID=500153 RepID=UPI000A4D7BFE|nr:divalent-cation tolerance protein CutA [Streptomyces avicenniae]